LKCHNFDVTVTVRIIQAIVAHRTYRFGTNCFNLREIRDPA